ncbi:MAG: hypothetical protein OEN48_17855 [Betaproteobacteria bacterium]|nr:hypothetical protein [Betaproteobacteria bacterium]
MPLWKLQNLGSDSDEPLYRRSEFADGTIRLLPGAPVALERPTDSCSTPYAALRFGITSIKANVPMRRVGEGADARVVSQ